MKNNADVHAGFWWETLRQTKKPVASRQSEGALKRHLKLK